MTVLAFLKASAIDHISEDQFVVVHPLDDVREKKVDTCSLGRMPMTISVKISLMALRGYLALMMLLVFYHVVDLAGVITHNAN